MVGVNRFQITTLKVPIQAVARPKILSPPLLSRVMLMNPILLVTITSPHSTTDQLSEETSPTGPRFENRPYPKSFKSNLWSEAGKEGTNSIKAGKDEARMVLIVGVNEVTFFSCTFFEIAMVIFHSFRCLRNSSGELTNFLVSFTLLRENSRTRSKMGTD